MKGLFTHFLLLTLVGFSFVLLAGLLLWLMPTPATVLFAQPIQLIQLLFVLVALSFLLYRFLRVFLLPFWNVHSTDSMGKYPKLSLFFVLFAGTLLFQGTVQAQVSGTVFRDYNASGTRTSASPSEPGERGITVTAYKPDGSNVFATTDASGNYSFTAVQIPSGTKVRVEFSGLPTGTYNGTFGAGNGTSVQFVAAPATNVNLGVLDAVEYCQTNPDLFTPCYVSGNPLIAGTSGPMDAMVKWGYSNTGTSPSPSHIATAAEVGSVWGMAYQRESKKLFSATILKRHVGLGSLGLGGIYMTDLNTNTVTPYINLTTLGVTLASPTQLTQLGSRALPSTATSSSSDPNVLGMVGKVGLGGMAIDPDGGKLWVMNVYEKKLVAITIGSPAVAGAFITAANVSQYAVPNPGCTNGEYRPWAVTYYRGKIYVGVICDGGTTSGTQTNLFAYVYEFNPATNTFNPTPIFSTTLNYTKGKVHTGDALLGSKWEPWRDTWVDIHAGASTSQGVRSARVQPILSALEFDTDGSMILGLMDRGGHQLGFKQQGVPNNGSFYNGYIGGDILRAQYNVGTGTYTLESNGVSGTKTGCGAGTAQGPGNGEFFCADNYPTSGSIIHEETFQGALTIVPGTGELTAMSMDPLAVWSGGPNYMSLNNGANIRRYNIYTTVNGSGSQIGQTQGKANGLGMIAVGCNPAPIEIGNFVWEDLDGDGIQDPSESPLSGITIELLRNNAVISTAVSDVSGRYIFSNQTGTSTSSFKYGITLLQANTAYQVRIPNVAGGSKQASLGNRAITVPTNDPSTNGNTRDSDGTLSGNNAVAAVTTGASGNNDHRIDFGFKPACTLNDAGWLVTCNNNGTNNTGADDRFTLTLNPIGSVLGVGYNVTGGVTAGPISYGSAQQAGGFFNISGGNLTITITDATDANCKLTNVVIIPPNTCSVPPPCLADAPDCGSSPGTSAATVEMDNLYFVGGAVATGTEIQHTIGSVDVRYTITSSDGTFSTVPGPLQTPSFINNYISTGGIGDGTFALVVANNSGATSVINKKFSKPISSLSFSVYDVDQNDVVTITGYLKGSTITNPTLTRPGVTPTHTVSGNVATGTGTAAATGNVNGTLNVSFGTQTLDSVKINIIGTTATYEVATGDFTYTSPNAPSSACGAALSRVDWNAAGVAYTAGSLSQTFTVSAGGETTDFRFTTTGNTAHLSAGSPTEATGVSTGGFFDAGQPSLQILADPAVSTSAITTSIKLSQARSDVRFSIGDIDDKANNRDQVKVQGFFRGALVKPTFRSDATEATFSINNMTATAVPWVSDASVNNTNFATLNVYFPGAVDSIAIMFTELSGVANPAQRELRISDILFCSECGFRAPETTLNVTTNGGTTGGGFTTQYALTSPDGTILDIQNTPSFTGTFNPGGYSIYPVNYSGTITNFATGQNINGVLGDCLDASKLMGCNVEVCLPVCNQLVSVTTANVCEGAAQNAVITHLAAPGQLALYYSTNANLTASLLYDTPTHATNGIVAVNTNITPTGVSTTVPMTLPDGNNYHLYVVFAAGNANYIPPYCEAMVRTAAPFTIFERPTANAGLDQTIAVPQNAILTATGGGTYLWSTTATTPSISVSPTTAMTTYTVTVTQNGCTSTDEVQVNVLPPVADAGEDYTICQGETATLLARGGGTYAWSGGAGSSAAATVNPVVTTTYTVTVTVGAQTSTDEVVVTVITDLPVAGVTPPQSIPNGSSVSLTATGGTYFAWQPNYPDSTATVMLTPPNNAVSTYNVEAWKNGCRSATSTSVTTFAPCQISSVTAMPSACVPATNQYTVTGVVTFANAPTSGTLTVQITGGGSQVINAPFVSPLNYSITGQTSDGASHTVTATFSADVACTNTVNYMAPANCTPIPCAISSVTATPGVCVPATNQYTVTGVVTFANAPASGTLTVQITGGGSQVLNAPFVSPLNYSIAGQTSDGASHTVTATFSADPACTNTVNYMAPANCTPCAISSVTAMPGACVPATNQYTVTGSVTFANAPTTGTLTVQIMGGGSQVFNAPFVSPLNYSIAGQTSDGASHTVTAIFSADPACTNTVNYMAPAYCIPCAISSVTASPSACIPATNQYSVTGLITFTDAPTTGTLTVQITGGASQVFNAPFVSPANYSIVGQISDGASHTVTATFSANTACTNTVNYMAPANCFVCPSGNCGTTIMVKN